MPSIGPLEILIVLVVAFLIFGAKRLPELGSSLGGGIREFGQGIKGDKPDEAEMPGEPAQALATAESGTPKVDSTK